MGNVAIVKSWKSWLKSGINDDKATVDTVNALIVVAGVQAQVISFTLPLPDNVLGKCANFFAVIGLLLDTVGTFLGVIHALLLQRRISYKSSLYDAIKEFEEGASEEIANQDLTTPAVCLNARGEEKMQASKALEIYVGQPQAPPSKLLSIRNATPWFKLIFSFGTAPLLAMASGVICLVLSIISFSAHSFGRQVLIGCLAVLWSMLFMSVIPHWYTRHQVDALLSWS